MTSDIEKAMFSDSELASKGVQSEMSFARLVMNVTEDLLVVAEAKGLNNADLARIVGVSRSNIHRQLSGERNMTLRTLSKLAFALGRDARVVLTKRVQVAHGSETVSVHKVTRNAAEAPPDRNQSSSSNAFVSASQVFTVQDRARA